MSDITDRSSSSSATTVDDRQRVSAPLGVHIGAGSDPRVLGLMAFALGTLVVGIATIGQFPLSAMAAVIPIAFFCSGLALAAASIWSFILGMSFLAGTFGIVAGFFSSYSILLLGLDHNWFAVSTSATGSFDEVFFIVWCCFFLALLLPSLRLPVIYPLTVALLVVYLALSATGTYGGIGSGNVSTAAGASILAASLLLFWGYLAASLTALNARITLPEGPVLLTGRSD